MLKLVTGDSRQQVEVTGARSMEGSLVKTQETAGYRK